MMERNRKKRVGQTPEDRMYKYYIAVKRSIGRDYYFKGYGHHPLMYVAMRFSVPIRRVREVLEARRADARTQG